jgi:hypothetical protein
MEKSDDILKCTQFYSLFLGGPDSSVFIFIKF